VFFGGARITKSSYRLGKAGKRKRGQNKHKVRRGASGQKKRFLENGQRKDFGPGTARVLRAKKKRPDYLNAEMVRKKFTLKVAKKHVVDNTPPADL